MTILFVKARWFTPTSGRRISLIILHSMEAPEKGTTAESVARYFATTTRRASAHYNVDNNSIVQSVRDQDVAWGAAGANRNGLHIEHAGYARQSAAEWADAYSAAMLRLSAALVAEKCADYGIPVRLLAATDLKAGKAGITTHQRCSEAFGGTHWDPGPHFPLDRYLSLVEEARAPQADLRLVFAGRDVTKTARPVEEAGRSFIRLGEQKVAVRELAGALGLSVAWDDETRTVTLK